jgi:uncharacterized protein YcbK (DUF882 family)
VSEDGKGENKWRDIKRFKPKEFTCDCKGLCDHEDLISTKLVWALDKIREQMGKPIKITSGTRCKRHNKMVGGSPYSAHLPLEGVSYAADIYCPDNGFRKDFLALAIQVFPRIGLGRHFIHVDLHPDLPRDLIWVY